MKHKLIEKAIKSISETIRLELETHFWDLNENELVVKFDEENVARYLEFFLPAVGIYNLPEEAQLGISRARPVFAHENIISPIDLEQYEVLIRRVLSEAGYEKVLKQVLLQRKLFLGNDILKSAPLLENKNLLRDTKDKSYRCFGNGYIEISADKVTEVQPYSAIPENWFVWSEHICHKGYKPSDNKGDDYFRHFVENLSRNSNNEFDADAFKRLQIVIGYLCHRYHRESQRKCVILMDRIDDPRMIGKCNGGTGKSLLIKCLSEVVHTITLDGKAFGNRNHDSFALAGVNETHELVSFDDAALRFDFERIFPHITGDFHIRRMRQNPVSIPGAHAPKICITSNHPIASADASHQRRQILVAVSPYYRQMREEYGQTPDEIHGGKTFCSDEWSENDWNDFYSFIIECIQSYLEKGLPRQDEEVKNMVRSQLIQDCGGTTLYNSLLEVLERASSSGEEVFCEQFYREVRRALPGLLQTDSALLGLLKRTAENSGYLFNPHVNGGSDQQRLTEDRWERWQSLGLNDLEKRGGGQYIKNDRISVFQIHKKGDPKAKQDLETLLDQSCIATLA